MFLHSLGHMCEAVVALEAKTHNCEHSEVTGSYTITESNLFKRVIQYCCNVTLSEGKRSIPSWKRFMLH